MPSTLYKNVSRVLLALSYAFLYLIHLCSTPITNAASPYPTEAILAILLANMVLSLISPYPLLDLLVFASFIKKL